MTQMHKGICLSNGILPVITGTQIALLFLRKFNNRVIPPPRI